MNGKYTCLSCGKTFDRKFNMNRHIQTFHKEEDEEESNDEMENDRADESSDESSEEKDVQTQGFEADQLDAHLEKNEVFRQWLDTTRDASRQARIVSNVHTVGQSLVHGVQDISVNVIELQGFVLPKVRFVIVEELRLVFGGRFPVGLFFSIGFLHTLRQMLFESLRRQIIAQYNSYYTSSRNSLKIQTRLCTQTTIDQSSLKNQ